MVLEEKIYEYSFNTKTEDMTVALEATIFTGWTFRCATLLHYLLGF